MARCSLLGNVLPESNIALLQTGVLGEGTFGVVLRARDPQSVGGGEIAIKLLPRGDFVSVDKPVMQFAPCMPRL